MIQDESAQVFWRLGGLDLRASDGLALTMVVEAKILQRVSVRGVAAIDGGPLLGLGYVPGRSSHPRAVSIEVQEPWPPQATWAAACSYHRRSNSAGGRLSAAPMETLVVPPIDPFAGFQLDMLGRPPGSRRLISSVL